MKEDFKINDKIIYCDKYEAIVVKLHKGYSLIDIEIKHDILPPTKTTVNTIHCKKQ
jgi:hypothetical protein